MATVKSGPPSPAQFDLVVIGGGINGAAIAREAALHGLSVAVIERDDLCSGTSAAATRLVHGGLRYLEYAELGLVFESLHAREQLLQTAPHLVEPLAFNIPIYRQSKRGLWTIRAGMWLYDLLSVGKSVARHTMLSPEQLMQQFPGLANEALLGGARYFDARIQYPERMVVELLLDAAAHGAAIFTHTAAAEITTRAGKISGVVCNRAQGQFTLSGKVVINAAGPWVDGLIGRFERRPLIGSTRGSHLVVDARDKLPVEALYTEAASDGRPFFVVPWNGLHLIGTTDERYSGDPGEVVITSQERDYLLAEAARVYPGAGDLGGRVRYAYAGLRALPYRAKGVEGAITRRHQVHRHRSVKGLYSIIGGKLTTHRALAIDVMRRIKKHFPDMSSKSPTKDRPLPGAISGSERAALTVEIEQQYTAETAARLLSVYGRRVRRVLEIAAESPELAAPICADANVLAAEIQLAFGEEWAQSLVDFLQRRAMNGLDANLGVNLVEPTANWMIRLGIVDAAEAARQRDAYQSWIDRYRRI